MSAVRITVHDPFFRPTHSAFFRAAWVSWARVWLRVGWVSDKAVHTRPGRVYHEIYLFGVIVTLSRYTRNRLCGVNP